MDEPAIVIRRSYIDPTSWVAVPYGWNVDQTYALHCGRLGRVKAWAAVEFGEGKPVTWRREGVDTWQMVTPTLAAVDTDPTGREDAHEDEEE